MHIKGEGEDIGDYAIKKLGFKSDFLGNNRIIWEKTDFGVHQSIVLRILKSAICTLCNIYNKFCLKKLRSTYFGNTKVLFTRVT
jgi:hypothetical protein